MNRRSFLQSSAVAAAGSLWGMGSVGSARSGRKMTMDLTCGSIGVKADQREAIRLAHKYGFESVAPDPGYLARLSGEELGALIDEVKELGLVFGAAGLPVDFRGDERKFRRDLASLPAFATLLRKAGVVRVGTWITPAHSELTYLKNFRQHSERLREVGKVLGGQGVRLGLEYVGPKTSWTSAKYPFIHTMAELKELLAEIGLSNVGFVLDSWHWYTAGETEADLMTLKDQDVVVVDLNDAPAGVPVDEQMDLKRALPMATGVIDLRTFLDALSRIGYDGPVRAEPFDAKLSQLSPDAAVSETAEALKKAFALVS